MEPDFGKSKVSALKKSDVKQFYNILADERGLQISTIDSVHTVLHQVLDMAVDDCYLRSNPSDNVLRELKKAHQFETTHRKALTVPEQNLLFVLPFQNTEVPALVSDFRGYAGNGFARRRSHRSALV